MILALSGLVLEQKTLLVQLSFRSEGPAASSLVREGEVGGEVF